ncbi:flavin monoamine oxidase family protein [uncultured Croceitalea sp.]|uniref:flavin monoamine oxidase family protein n=1 Tax=uncultured Croceitalea sp. TaxID=1798908 RepID=UPI00374F9562
MASYKYIIVGAGLTGLSVAYQLMKSGIEDFILLEGRNRIGGRILTEGGIDLGAAWFQQHHDRVREILQELEMVSFEQYVSGKGIITSKSGAPIQYFEAGANGLPTYRIAEGSNKLIEQLAKGFPHKIQLQTKIIKVENTSEGLKLYTKTKVFKCHKAVVCIPPKLACQMVFEPSLPNPLIELMQKTYTWMSHAIKVGLTFSSPFWREQGFSGIVFGQSSPVTEMYDHSSLDGKVFGLMGFVNEELHFVSEEERKRIIINFLENLFGKEINNHLTYSDKDWSKDNFTSIEDGKTLPYKSFYGNALFNKSYHNEKLFFAAAETSYINGGYMDGAIVSGFETANKMIQDIT